MRLTKYRSKGSFIPPLRPAVTRPWQEIIFVMQESTLIEVWGRRQDVICMTFTRKWLMLSTVKPEASQELCNYENPKPWNRWFEAFHNVWGWRTYYICMMHTLNFSRVSSDSHAYNLIHTTRLKGFNLIVSKVSIYRLQTVHMIWKFITFVWRLHHIYILSPQPLIKGLLRC